MKRNGYFTSQMIIDITGGRDTFFLLVCMDCRGVFELFLIRMLCNGLNIADNEA